MRTFAINATNDLYLGHNGQLAIATDLQAVLHCCKTAMQAQLGEMQYEMQRGMPDFETAFNTYNPAQYEAAGRSTLTAVTGVVQVLSFSVTRHNGQLIYTATIQTVYGEGNISNG